MKSRIKKIYKSIRTTLKRHLMDNRRVFSSYKDKVRKSAQPYPLPGGGIFSKVKRLFSPAPFEDSNSEEVHPFKFAPSSTNFSSKVSYNGSSTMTPLKIPGSFEVHTSPNHILSSFFQRKGDEPLNDIEYEGVVSLMSKSGTPMEDIHKKRTHDANESTVIRPKRLKENDLFIMTPQQRNLRNNTFHNDVSNISIPEYQPVYHTFTNDSNTSRSNRSVRRVYQFSGLPLPYRTRIRAPSLSRLKHRTSNLSNISIDATQITPRDESNILEKRPISEAANTLLSILDGKSQEPIKEDQTQSNIKLFSNPYASTKSKRRAEKPSITATDINKTLLFDKSQPLPIVETKEEVEPKETKMSRGNAKKVPESSFDFKFSNSTMKVDSSSLTENSNEVSNKPEQLHFKASKKAEPISLKASQNPDLLFKVKTSNFESNHSSNKPLQQEQTPIPSTNAFSFNTSASSSLLQLFSTAEKPKAIDNSQVSTKSNFISKESTTFIFPNVEITKVILDSSKVAQYRPLYEFIV